MVKQNTLQTPNTGVANTTGYSTDNGGVKLVSVKDGSTAFSIKPNRYIHMRMYVWIEGQDVDCINYASLGGAVTINVGLSKPGTTTTATEEGH